MYSDYEYILLPWVFFMSLNSVITFGETPNMIETDPNHEWVDNRDHLFNQSIIEFFVHLIEAQCIPVDGWLGMVNITLA